jgi:hypothetical protein
MISTSIQERLQGLGRVIQDRFSIGFVRSNQQMNITTSSEEDDESRRQVLCFEDLHYHLRHHGGSVRPTSMAQATSPPIDLPDLARRAVFLHHNDEDLRCITEDTMSSSQVTALLFSRPAINGLPIRRPVGLVEREPNWRTYEGYWQIVQSVVSRYAPSLFNLRLSAFGLSMSGVVRWFLTEKAAASATLHFPICGAVSVSRASEKRSAYQRSCP